MGRHTYFNKLDWCILWHLLSKQNLNLAYLIFKRILNNTIVRSLPYGMILTLVFKKLKIKLTKEKKGVQILVIKEIYAGKVEKKRKDKKIEKGKEKMIVDDSISSFSSKNSKDIRIKIG